MRLPEIADQLRTWAEEWGKPELIGAADQIRRRPSQRAPARSRPMSDDLVADIRWYAARYPDLSQAEIAKKCGCNQGRVSEVLKGKRA